jgi:hypothetical protein
LFYEKMERGQDCDSKLPSGFEPSGIGRASFLILFAFIVQSGLVYIGDSIVLVYH